MAPKSMDLKKGAQVMLIKNMDDTLVNGSLGKVIGFMAEATFANWAMTEHGSGGLDDEWESMAAPKGKSKPLAETRKARRIYGSIPWYALQQQMEHIASFYVSQKTGRLSYPQVKFKHHASSYH
ncbi:hypothetical protein RRF57_003324 [Xylaria bambusicola]|uniref:DNA helicase Pif1-like 2B domain-containing protein n=1 Tax=Xylaria bambusicola TaxID=326684 RepID=A0AAN7UEL0_9PEZI